MDKVLDQIASQPLAPLDSCDLELHGFAKIAAWGLQIMVAAILAQTLFFKFTYAPETQVIFQNIGGRFAATATGIVELVCVVLLLIPRTSAIGALLSLGTISGAILAHIFFLGFKITDPNSGENDGGLLFGLALAVAMGSLLIIAIRRKEILFFGQYLKSLLSSN